MSLKLNKGRVWYQVTGDVPGMFEVSGSRSGALKGFGRTRDLGCCVSRAFGLGGVGIHGYTKGQSQSSGSGMKRSSVFMLGLEVLTAAAPILRPYHERFPSCPCLYYPPQGSSPIKSI